MKKLIAKNILILLIMALAMSAAACDTTGPEPEVTPTPTRRPSPTPSPSPTPTPTPAPELGLLQLNEIYYMNGDKEQMGIAFTEDWAAFNSNGDEARYEVKGSIVSLYFNDEWDSDLRVIDAYILEEMETGIRFIRESGDGFGGVTGVPDGSREIFYETYYYLDGEAGYPSLYFYDFGEVVMSISDKPELGKYTIFNGWIMITVGGEERLVMQIRNAAELVDDDNSEVFALEGAIGAELMLNERYYQFGEPEDIAIIFLEEGELIFEFMEDIITTGTYTVEGDRIAVDLDGEEAEMIIVNNYVITLVSQGLQFIRIPE